MKKIFLVFLPFVLILGFSVSKAQTNEAKLSCQGLILIQNVTVIPMTGEDVIQNAIVRIQNGKILSVTDIRKEAKKSGDPESYEEDVCDATGLYEGVKLDAENKTPKELFEDVKNLTKNLGPKVINGEGKFLIPGLSEMHGHIPNAASYDQDLKDLLFLYLSSGVTTVRGMLGNDGQLQLQKDILAGSILGPTLYLGGPSFNGNTVSSPLQARKRVRDQVEEGWDFLKIHPGLTLDEYNAMADEAKKQGITWGGHVPSEVGLRRALEAGQITIDHMDGYELFTGTITLNGFSGEVEGDQIKPVDPVLLKEAIELTLKSGAVVVPTNALWSLLLGGIGLEELMARPEIQYVSRPTLASWQNRYQDNRQDPAILQIIENRAHILKALFDAGVPILLGSDAPQFFSVPGFSIPREMENMVEAGLDPKGILLAGTAKVGDFFADYDTFGRIAPGNRADLVLLNSNPLEDISNIRDIAGVMVRGTWLARETIDTELAEIAMRNSQ